MGYKLIISKEAHRDLDDIVDYIACGLKNSQAAKEFLSDVENRYRNLICNPFMYNLCKDKRLENAGYRRIPIKNYLIIYRVNEKEKSILIVRAIYGARDYAKLL